MVVATYSSDRPFQLSAARGMAKLLGLDTRPGSDAMMGSDIRS